MEFSKHNKIEKVWTSQRNTPLYDASNDTFAKNLVQEEVIRHLCLLKIPNVNCTTLLFSILWSFFKNLNF